MSASPLDNYMAMQLALAQHHIDDAERYQHTGHEDAAQLSLEGAEEGVRAVADTQLPENARKAFQRVVHDGVKEEEDAGLSEESTKKACAFQYGMDVFCAQAGITGPRRDFFRKVAAEMAAGRLISAVDVLPTLTKVANQTPWWQQAGQVGQTGARTVGNAVSNVAGGVGNAFAGMGRNFWDVARQYPGAVADTARSAGQWAWNGLKNNVGLDDAVGTGMGLGAAAAFGGPAGWAAGLGYGAGNWLGNATGATQGVANAWTSAFNPSVAANNRHNATAVSQDEVSEFKSRLAQRRMAKTPQPAAPPKPAGPPAASPVGQPSTNTVAQNAAPTGPKPGSPSATAS